MIRPESLHAPPLHVSLDPTLGDYYQDFSVAIDLVESGYHGGLDDAGVPWVTGTNGRIYSPITTAQYALANLAAARRGDFARAKRARVLTDWLVSAQESTGEWKGCWLMSYDNPKYPWLRAPWTSSIASGNCISTLLRGWEFFGEQDHRVAAEAAYDALHIPRSEMQIYTELGDQLWYEEFPSDRPLHVLNGHIYTLLGVADYARVSGDPEADARWRLAARTALAHLSEFDLGYWSAYDLRFREPTSVYYHKNIHIPQLRILAELTDEAAFGAVADRWEGYLRGRLSRGRRFVAARLQRWRR